MEKEREKGEEKKSIKSVEVPSLKSYQIGQSFYREFIFKAENDLKPENQLKTILLVGLPLYETFQLYGDETLLIESPIEASNYISVFRDIKEQELKRKDMMRSGLIPIKFDTTVTKEQIELYRQHIENDYDYFGVPIYNNKNTMASKFVNNASYDGTLIKDESEKMINYWLIMYKELRIVFKFQKEGQHKLYLVIEF
jgi:hypothetical protein